MARRALVVVLVMVAAAVLAAPAAAAVSDAWTSAAPPSQGRFSMQTALLPSGKVLVAGGAASPSTYRKSAESYDPASGVWAAAADMTTARAGGAAVVLANGKVLVAGGATSSSFLDNLNTAEVYDPATNAWTPVMGTMSSARGNFPVAALLPGGKVLIAGGVDASNHAVLTADLYDPATNTFTPAASMALKRQQAEFAPLPGGRVLVAGGVDDSGTPLSSGEVYDAATNSWSPVANSMSNGRGTGAAATLPGGKVLIAGGSTGPTFAVIASTDIYDPSTNSFTPGAAMQSPRAAFVLTALADGRVLAAGGDLQGGGGPTVSSASELYDPRTNAWTSTPALPSPVVEPGQALLQNGQVLVIGGVSDLAAPAGVAQAALFTPSTRPGVPLAVAAAPGNGSALVSFAPPASDGGLPVLHYTITASTGQTASTADGRTIATVAGLRNGSPVTFTVTATNALGTGPGSTPSNAVIPIALPADKPAQLRISGLKTKLKLKAFLKGITFSETPNKAASLQISLIGSVNRATIARAFNLTLARKSLRLSARRQTIKLVPSKKLVGNPRRAKVELVIVATDAAGSRSTTTRMISLSR
jgi:N-acetylneuraminic acid mutarotase